MSPKLKITHRFTNMSPDEVRRLWESGAIPDEEFDDYLAIEDIRASGFYGADPANIKHLYMRNQLDDDQVDDYLEANESPVWFYTKDLLKAPVYGAASFAKNLGQLTDSMLSLPNRLINAVAGRKVLDDIKLFEPKVPKVLETKTTAGDLLAEVAQFLIPFAGTSKVVTKTGAVAAILGSEKIAPVLSKMPKTKRFLEVALHGTLSGVPADLLQDPFEGRAVDAARELGILPDVLEFLLTDPDGPEEYERLKSVVEGAALGVVADGLIEGIKLARAVLWTRHGNSQRRVAEAVRELAPDAEPRTIDGVHPPEAIVAKPEIKMEPERVEAKPEVPERAEVKPEEPKRAEAQPEEPKRTEAQAAPRQADEFPAGRVYQAYQEMVTERGFSWVSIAKLAKAAQVDLEDLKEYIKAEGRAGRAVLGLGDWSLSSDEVRAGAIEMFGRPHLLISFEAPPPASVYRAVAAPKTIDDIKAAPAHRLTYDEFKQKVPEIKLPKAEDIVDNPRVLGFEDYTVDEVKAIAEALGVDAGAKRSVVEGQIREMILFKSLLDRGHKALGELPLTEIKNFATRILGQGGLPRGRAATVERYHSLLMEALTKRIEAAKDEMRRAMHGAEIRKAIKRGEKVPESVYEEYKGRPWIKQSDVQPTEPKRVEPDEPKRAEPEEPKRTEAQPEEPKRTEPEKPKRTEAQPEEPKRTEARPEASSADMPRPVRAKAPDGPDREKAALRIFKAQSGKIRGIHDVLVDDADFLGKVERASGHGTVALLNNVYHEAEALIEGMRARGSGGLKEIDRRANQIWDRLAELSGKSPDQAAEQFMATARGIALDMRAKAAQAHFLNEFMVTYTKQVDDLIERALREDSAELQLKAITHIKQLEELTALAFGVRAEAGRMLRSYSMGLRQGKFDFTKMVPGDIERIMASSGSDIKETLRAFKAAQTPAEKMRIARTVGSFRFLRGLLEFQQVNLLWSPVTHMANIIGNATNMAGRLFTRTMALSLHALTKGDINFLIEAREMYKGLVEGLVAAVKFEGLTKAVRGDIKVSEVEAGNMWKALWRGESIIDTVVKEDASLPNSLLEAAAKSLPQGSLWAVPLIRLYTMPFRFLAAGDELFKNLSYHSTVAQLAYRRAVELGYKGELIEEAVRSIKKDLPEEIHWTAVAEMRKATFQETLRPFGQGLERALASGPGIIVRLLTLPFFATPANIISQTFEYTPFAVLQKNFREAIAKAGSVEQKEAIIRMLTGTAAFVGLYSLYRAGYLTGRKPENIGADWEAVGAQEYSVYVPSKKSWISYSRIEPFGTLLGLVADTYQSIDVIEEYITNEESEIKLKQAVAALILMFTEATINKTWMTSMRTTVQLITGAENMNIERYLAQQVEKYMPGATGMKWLNEMADQYSRQYHKIIDGVYSVLDRQKLQPRRNPIDGTPVPKTEKTMAFLRTTKSSEDIVDWELFRVGAHIQPMTKTIVRKGIVMELTPEEYGRVNDILSELPVRNTLRSIIESDDYKALGGSPELQKKILTRVLGKFKSAAKAIFLAESKERQQELVDEIKKQAFNIMAGELRNDPIAGLQPFLKQHPAFSQPE